MQFIKKKKGIIWFFSKYTFRKIFCRGSSAYSTNISKTFSIREIHNIDKNIDFNKRTLLLKI